MKLMSLAVEVWSHNHWKAREVPHGFLLNIFQFLTVFKGNNYMEEVLKALDALGSYTFTTKLRRNKYSQIYCQNCENIIPVNAIAAHELDSCPFCSLPIKECKFDN